VEDQSSSRSGDTMTQRAVDKKVVDDDWRRWIAENLSLGGDPAELLRILVANGFEDVHAAQEMKLALGSPYILGARQAAERLANRLKKHDWVLDIRRVLNRQDPSSATIERRHQLGRDEFYKDYYLRSKPVIITGMLDDWPARKKWSLSYLKEQLGEREVQVQMGRNQDAAYEIKSDQFRKTMKLKDYIGLIESAGETNDFYMTANNASGNRVALTELWQDIGRLPEYLNVETPDDGFLWLGPAGTRTPFHHDLTNNFMAQVMGRKLVKLIPACELPYVYNDRHCYSQVDGHNIDYERFPLMRRVQILECILAPGEILFLPVGCWHYVEGLDVSITVSAINFQLENDYSTFYTTYNGV
jgi:hypothetical protein